MTTVEMLDLILISSNNYTQGILKKDISTPEFFTEQILALTDEIYEFYEISGNLTEEYYTIIKKYGIKLLNNIDPSLDELADILCFVSNLINHYELKSAIPFNFTFDQKFVSEDNFNIQTEWLPKFNLCIRNLIRNTDTWKTWKVNNKRFTDLNQVEDTLNKMLYLISQVIYKIYHISNYKIRTDQIYKAYKQKVISNIKKQFPNELDPIQFGCETQEIFFDSFFNKSGFLY